MAIVKWDPFGDVVAFRDRIDKWLEEELGRTAGNGSVQIQPAGK